MCIAMNINGLWIFFYDIKPASFSLSLSYHHSYQEESPSIRPRMEEMLLTLSHPLREPSPSPHGGHSGEYSPHSGGGTPLAPSPPRGGHSPPPR